MLQHPHKSVLALLCIDQILVFSNDGKALLELLLAILLAHMLLELAEVTSV